MEFCQILKAVWQESWKEAGVAGVILQKKILKGMWSGACAPKQGYFLVFTGYTILEGR